MPEPILKVMIIANIKKTKKIDRTKKQKQQKNELTIVASEESWPEVAFCAGPGFHIVIKKTNYKTNEIFTFFLKVVSHSQRNEKII